MVRHCDEAVANPVTTVYLSDRVAWFYDCCAAERSLALLVSDYRGLRQRFKPKTSQALAVVASANCSALIPISSASARQMSGRCCGLVFHLTNTLLKHSQGFLLLIVTLA